MYHTVLHCLDAKGSAVAAPKSAGQVVNPRQDFFQSMDAKTFREQGAKPNEKVAEKPTARPAAPARPVWDTEWKSAAKVADSQPQKPLGFRPLEKPAGAALGKAPSSVMERRETAPVREAPVKAEAPAMKEAPVKQEVPKRSFVPAIPAERQTALNLPEQTTIEEPKEAPWRIAGEVLHTYIVCESEDGCVWLIDKHAAHERVNFDRLKAAREPVMRQTLLQPVAAELSREDGALLLENLELLEQFGFACEDFGDGAVLVREVPADIDAGDTVSTLEELAENLRSGKSLEEKRENLLHTMACKAAIKGGWTSDVSELKVLVEKVQSGEVKYCPHGRPVAVKLTKYELEKMFKRA